jgi:hypothetical protein
VTDPPSPTRPAARAAADRAAPLPALRLLTTDDDLACVDDLCLPAGARDRLDAPAADPATPVTVTERDR